MRSRILNLWTRGRGWVTTGPRSLLPFLFAQATPLDLRIVGRTLFHAALVGALAGLAGAAFFGGLEAVQRFFLEDLAGYAPLRAYGQSFSSSTPHVFRPWLLCLLPAFGGLACGLLTRLAPETRGGGGDAMIRAFHHQGGVIRKRVISIKAVASLFTLGTGGAGGREGPTMQIGGALGSLVADLLGLSVRERRLLLVAGVAAGLSAIFRTPLGAALLAVEVLYEDGFESDALVPAVLASVVSYSVFISIYGENTLFTHASHFTFIAGHLPLYALLAIFEAIIAASFVSVLHNVHRIFRGLPLPPWARPAAGGLILGIFCTTLVLIVGSKMHREGGALGLFGGGYGGVQVAISGAAWLPVGWAGVGLLLFLSIAKVMAASITIGSEGSAGDFAPSLAIGGLLGGAFGRAMVLLTHDPRLDPGAFALVGMGAFYGGIAHVPLSALVLVCEMAGNYDLLVPLMLTQGIVFVALRNRALYDAQVPTQADSPVHRDALVKDVLASKRVEELMTTGRPYIDFRPQTPVSDILARAGQSTWQDVFPVTDDAGKMIGLVSSAVFPVLVMEREGVGWVVTADVMQPPVFVKAHDDLRRAAELLLQNGLREIPVVDEAGRIVGFLDEAEVAKAYIRASAISERPPDSVPVDATAENGK